MGKKILITGIAGFIGCNTAERFLEKGDKVAGIDNLSRAGTEKNLQWLKSRHKDWKFYLRDIRERQAMKKIVAKEKPDVIFHFAGQVAVTTSVVNPQEDREINIDGTLNLLEAARNLNRDTIFIYSSTNKVYGGLDDHKVIKRGGRYAFAEKALAKNGISEKEILDFHSPYGCSKGAADQYVRDYARIYGLPTIVFRQSCIYGSRQFGNEDQGWVIHFVRRAVEKVPINIYGNGRQVRDILDVRDLIDAYEKGIAKIRVAKGQIYNVGGGPQNTVSLLELISILGKKLGRKIKTKFGGWRPGDQKVYVSDIRKAKKELGWIPKIAVSEGIDNLLTWAKEIT